MFTANLKKVFLITLMLIMAPAWALDLKQAKSQGLVGEQRNGYLGMVVDNPEARRIVKEVNAKRKKLYQNLANKNKVALAGVEQLGGEKAIAKTKAGHFIQNSAGKWVKK